MLTVAERTELEAVARAHEHWRSASTPPYAGYSTDRRVAHRLVRKGYLERRRYSEQIRGERRFYWWAFYLTPKGRKAKQKR